MGVMKREIEKKLDRLSRDPEREALRQLEKYLKNEAKKK